MEHVSKIMSTQTAPTFRTSDIRLAALAKAAGGELVELDNSNPARLVFVFAGVPRDFQLRVFSGKVTLDAGAVLSSLEQVHGLLADFRRGRR